MLRRINIVDRDENLSVTPLTAWGLFGTSRKIEIEDTDSDTQFDPKSKEFNVFQKQYLKRKWYDLSSEEIIEKLQRFSFNKIDNEDSANIRPQSEILLMKALALEKNIASERKNIIDSYIECREGHFNLGLILNNLAVLKAKDDDCEDALKYFRDSIFACLEQNMFLTAPFYNFVLVIDQLVESGLMSDFSSRILDEVAEKIRAYSETTSGISIKVPGKSGRTDKHLEKCQEIIKFIRSVRKPTNSVVEVLDMATVFYRELEFYSAKANYIIPQFDVLGSFGDKRDSNQYHVAHEQIRRARQFAEKKEFDMGISTLEMALESLNLFTTDSAYLSTQKVEINHHIEELSDEWRTTLRNEIDEFCKSDDFEGAINHLLVASGRLFENGKMQEREKFLREIRTMQILSEIEKIKNLFEGSDEPRKKAEAISKCEQLLLNAGLNNEHRKIVSNYLIELQKDFDD